MALVSGQAVKGHLDTMLLAVIRDGANYGYAIAERLRTQSDGLFDLPDGTIYPALRRLEDKGFLTSEWVSLGERKRKVYSLTGKGERELVRRRGEWLRFQRSVGTILGGEA